MGNSIHEILRIATLLTQAAGLSSVIPTISTATTNQYVIPYTYLISFMTGIIKSLIVLPQYTILTQNTKLSSFRKYTIIITNILFAVNAFTHGALTAWLNSSFVSAIADANFLGASAGFGIATGVLYVVDAALLLCNKDIIEGAIEGGKEGWEKGWKKGYDLGYNFTNGYKDQTPSMPQYNLGGYY